MNGDFDPYNLDREEFNPDLCLLRITQDCSLPQIVSRKNHLDMEMKGIVAGIQNLLYDNYAKFITASEVITKIKNDFGKMEDDMHFLESKMNSIENVSNLIVKNLQPTKDKKLKLIQSKVSVDKLALLVNLIPMLKEYIEQGDLVSAAKHYLKAKNLLEQHQNSKSLKGIIEESKYITSYIREKLSNKLDCCVYGREEISETMNLILDLGETETEILKNFLLISKYNLDRIIQKIRKNCFNCNDDVIMTESKIAEHSSNYLDVLLKVIEIVQLSSKSTTLSWSAVLMNFVEERTQQLFLLAGSAFKHQFGSIKDESLAYSLDLLYRKMYKCSNYMPKMAISEKSADFVLDICNDRCAFHLNRLKQGLQTCLNSLEEQLKSNHTFDYLLTWMSGIIFSIFTDTLHSLCNFISPGHKFSRNAYFRKNFCKRLAREKVFVPFLQDINDAIAKSIHNLNANEEVSLKMCILLTKYLLQLHQTKVWNFLSLVDERLHSSTENLTLTSASEIANKCKETAEKVIGCYIKMKHRRWSDMFRHSMMNKEWMMAREPWKVSAVVKIVLEDFYAAVKEIEDLFECTKSPARDRSNDSGKSAGLSCLSRTNSPENKAADDRMALRIHKLFLKPSTTSEMMEFSSDCILNHILKMTLKSLLEFVRQRTFNRFGLQQIQVDVHCLELHASQYTKNEPDIESLFDEILSSCYCRTVKPEFMNIHIVLALCQNLLI